MMTSPSQRAENYSLLQAFLRQRARDFQSLPISILLMPVWVVDKFPMQLLRFLSVEFLPAIGALETTSHLDANIFNSVVSRFGCITDFHRFWHCVEKKKVSCTYTAANK